MSLRDEILALAATGATRTIQTLDAPPGFPSTDGKVRLRSMMANERDEWDLELTRRTEQAKTAGAEPRALTNQNLRGRILAATICDAAGALVFLPADADALGHLPVQMIEPIFEAALTAAALTTKEVDRIAGESGAVPSGSLPSTSR